MASDAEPREYLDWFGFDEPPYDDDLRDLEENKIPRARIYRPSLWRRLFAVMGLC